MKYAADGSLKVDDSSLDIVGTHGTNASLASAVTLTPPAGADRIQIQVQGGVDKIVRYTLDGTTPTASVGFQMYAGDLYRIQIGTGMTLKIIQETTGTSVAYQWGK